MKNYYQISKGLQSQRTKDKQIEHSGLFYDSRNTWDENIKIHKQRRLPYVNHQKRAKRQAEIRKYLENPNE